MRNQHHNHGSEHDIKHIHDGSCNDDNCNEYYDLNPDDDRTREHNINTEQLSNDFDAAIADLDNLTAADYDYITRVRAVYDAAGRILNQPDNDLRRLIDDYVIAHAAATVDDGPWSASRAFVAARDALNTARDALAARNRLPH